MPARQLPRSNVKRAQVFRAASLKGTVTPAPDRAVSAALWAQLDLEAGSPNPAKNFLAALATLDTAEHALSLTTEDTGPLTHAALQIISHFFQVLDFAIARGVFPASVRDFYGRNPGDDTLPVLRSQADALEWGDKIAVGEAARSAVGGTPLAFPSAAEVALAIYNLILALGPHTIAKDALTDAQQAVENLLPGPTGIDALLTDLYDEVEFHYRHLPDGARRDKCREWGLIYDEDEAEEPTPPTPPPGP